MTDPMHGLTDAAKCPLRPGDLLLNDQGKVWVVQPTDRLTAAQCVAQVKEARYMRVPGSQQGSRWRAHGELTYLRLGQAIRVGPSQLHPSSQPTRRRLYDNLYAELVAPASRAELAARKQAIKDHKAWIKEEQR